MVAITGAGGRRAPAKLVGTLISVYPAKPFAGKDLPVTTRLSASNRESAC
jgi:hypothetical protein